ncbi:hypothetical protein BRD00_06990 [Halobacteriales archaeon QS_8_69_26]|nr:MAG: hypothetical protein BRD00_06990 [Halobacteriales archaeon QS_8_69_26]
MSDGDVDPTAAGGDADPSPEAGTDGTEPEPDRPPDVPEWDDEFLDEVATRLMFNYDLEKDYTVDGRRFGLYGRMDMHHEKHFLHPALSFAHHDSYEHVFARRADGVRRRDVDALLELGHDLADEWIDANEEHYSTDFTFALVTDAVPDDLAEFVSEFRERTMIKRGYYGHYEVHLVLVAPGDERVVASREAHLADAFRLWDPIEEGEPSWWDLITRRLQL